MKLKKTIFIALEGGEGVGKSTQIKHLQHTLQTNGYSVVITREPGGLASAEDIRNVIFNNNIANTTELLLFTASRHENIINNILPNLNKVDFIISDRFVLSSLVYQGVVGGYSIPLISQLHQIANNNLYPDLTIILDVNPKVALKRIINRNNLNKFDDKGVDYHKQIATGYRKYNDFYPYTTVVLDTSNESDLFYQQEGNLSVNAIHKKIINSINTQFNLNIKPSNISNNEQP